MQEVLTELKFLVPFVGSAMTLYVVLVCGANKLAEKIADK